MDLSKLSLVQLQELQQRIPSEIKRREAEEKANVLNELRAFAKSRGFAIEDLLGKETKVKAAGSKVRVKYRHPDNAELEWTGRGRKPKWVETWLAEGKALEGLLV
ncbi:H-NS histone family protein [Dechloromonas agitata]|uniref:H-NS histone family protein n=1 Tax=Dechloromonas agitata TaxID=73030 RepID=UPI0004825470|nr:H-NS histone family protein [Dechloromonas agitata]